MFTDLYTKYRKYLPSPKLVRSFLYIIAFSLFIYCMFHLRDIAGIFTFQKNHDFQPTETKDLLAKDTDGDEIPDWEEALWGTDPKKVDSNGNGISDTDEIEKRKKELSPDGTSSEELNETDTFSRELLSTIVALKQEGSLNSATLNSLATNLTNNLEEQRLLPDDYKQNDIEIVAKSKTNAQKYGTQTRDLIINSIQAGAGTEINIISTALNDDDDQNIASVRGIAELYKKLAGDLANVPVPSDIAVAHLRLVNDYSKLSTALTSLTEIFDNPVVSVVGLSQYRTYADDINSTITTIDKLLANNGIVN